MKKFYLVFLALVLLFIPTSINAVAVYQLDQPISELNNHTLREVFDSIVINPTFDSGNANWLLTANGSVSNGIYTFITTSQYGNIRQVAPLSYENDKLYVVSRFKSSSDQVVLLSRGNITNTSFNQIAHSGSNNFEIKSMNWVNTTNQVARFSIVDNRVSGWSNIEVDYIYVANQTSLGISSLTVEQMDVYFNLYLEAVRFENENIEASQDPGGYQNIFKSVINGVKGLIVEMGNVWQFLNAPIITSDMSDYSFSIDWSWDLIGVVRQLINSLAILILQTNFIFINLLFSFTGIPVQISILSMIFSNFVFVILGWIIVKSFII